MAKKAKPKKRGVKPGTKRGRYQTRKQIVAKLAKLAAKVEPWKVSENQVGPVDVKAYAPKPGLTVCGQLEDAILLLEQRISNATSKINSLMG